MTSRRTPVVEGLFAETPAGPRLLGSKCRGCGTPYFPRSPVCHNPDCRDKRIEDATFGPRGTLWSFTIQHYAPPPPVKYDEPFTPYALALVDLQEGLRVLGRVSTDNLEALTVGTAVELVIEKLCTGPDGNEVSTWKFKPFQV
ncbi:MAG: Zn-ribbon domain-containing OB-fold protein [Candidatus Binatia bacterium]